MRLLALSWIHHKNLFLFLPCLKTFISPTSVCWRSPPVLSKPRRVTFFVCQNISFPYLELNFSLSKVSFADSILVLRVHCVSFTGIVCAIHGLAHSWHLSYLLTWRAFKALISRLRYKLDPVGHLGPYRIFNVGMLRWTGVLGMEALHLRKWRLGAEAG